MASYILAAVDCSRSCDLLLWVSAISFASSILRPVTNLKIGTKMETSRASKVICYTPVTFAEAATIIRVSQVLGEFSVLSRAKHFRASFLCFCGFSIFGEGCAGVCCKQNNC
jgi:hypothetical protein